MNEIDDIVCTTADRRDGWFAIQMDNRLIRLNVIPEIGGRVMDLSLGDKRVFYSNPRHYGRGLGSYSDKSNLISSPNYGGSKVWPGPQGWSSEQEWPGPPDPVLDLGAYTWEMSCCPASARVQLQSSHDEYSGVTLDRELTVRPGSSTVHLRHRMRNTSMRPVRWSIWQVTQIEAAPGLEIVAPAQGVRQILGDQKYQSVAFDEREKRVCVKYEDTVAKLSVNAHGGWMTSFYRDRGIVLTEMFGTVPGAEYPDGAPIALWINGEGTFTIHGDQLNMSESTSPDPFVETEIMSPLTRLDPGESYEFKTTWSVAAFGADRITSVNHCGVVGDRLSIGHGQTRVSGSFGVFWDGSLELVAYNRASRVIYAVELGRVSPLQAVQIDARITLPSETVRCSLVLSERGRLIGVLDHVSVC